MSFTVAIVGRPNVGKSSLFNRLIGKPLALVDDTPGVTRDRREGKASLGSMHFTVIDTAGLEEAESDRLEYLMMAQTEHAVEDADISLMVIDGKAGITAMDEFFCRWLHKKNKPVILLVNKCDSKLSNDHIHDSYRLGFGDPVLVSAQHNTGMADLMERLMEEKKRLGIADEDEDENHEAEDFLRLVILGRPNVGKSTLTNRLLKEDRMITGPQAGITRDSISIPTTYKGRPLELVDTAGIRRRARVTEKLEKMSVQDSLLNMRYANVVVLLLDATMALEKQDLSLADKVIEEGRGLIIAVNKWDLIEHQEKMMEEIRYRLSSSLSQIRDIPVITLSALQGKNVEKVLDAAFSVFDTWNVRVSTGALNRWLEEALSRHPPPLAGGRRVKLRYITQAKTRPPTFVVFSSSNIRHLPESYLRYLSNDLRESFGFVGVPIRLRLKKSDNPYSSKNF